LFLQVRGLDGYSENGYEFWAGPSVSEDTSGRIAAPSYVNARQVFLNLARSVDEAYHSSLGVGVFGMGHLPMNSLVEGSPVDIPLAYLGPEFAGQKITIEMFDPDAHAVDPIMFYFDTISVGDWSLCYDDNGDDDYPYEVVPLESATCNSLYSVGRDGPANIPHGSQWQTPPYVLTIPNEASDGIPFYGGRLVARYPAGQNDTYGWRITLKSRPFLVR
jgi:hypothetical protein